MIICATTLLALAAQEPVPTIVVHNPAPVGGRAVVRASLPLPKGRFREPPSLGFDGAPAVAQPLLWWPDGSLMVVQVQADVRLAAGEERVVEVELGATPAAPGVDRWFFDGTLPFFTELVDPWGRVFVARFDPDPTAGDDDGWLQRSDLVRVRRYRALHLQRGEPEHAFLGLDAYLVSFRGARHAELTVVLTNHGDGDLAFGPARFGRFSLCSDTDQVRFRPRYAVENLLRPPLRRSGGGFRQHLLGPSDQLYLGDRTAKAFRFDLFWNDGDVDAEEREFARWQVTHQVNAFATLDWVRSTGAFGAHGGPAPSVARGDVARILQQWRFEARFGPFGGFGDPEDSAASGTLRNGPSRLHNVVRWRSGDMARAAEAVTLQHTLRPTPGHVPRLSESTAAYRAGLSKRAIERPHGFTPLDYEHFSVILLYDHYWLTGDPLALQEIRRAGSGLRPLLEGLPFKTSRGEGWCLQAGMLIARALRDDELRRYLLERFHEHVVPDIAPAGAGHAIRQPPHPAALGDGVWFDAPWQMAALVHGLSILHADTGDPVAAEIAVRVALNMARSGWVDGEGPKYLVSALDPTSYVMPLEDSPMTTWMEVGAFVLARSLTVEEDDRSLLLTRADALMRGPASSLPSDVSGNPWFQIYLDRIGPH